MSDIQSEKLAAESAEKAWFEIYQYRPHSWMLMMDIEKAFRMATRAATLAIDCAVANLRQQLAAAQTDTKQLRELLEICRQIS
jgi:hypothetical protein